MKLHRLTVALATLFACRVLSAQLIALEKNLSGSAEAAAAIPPQQQLQARPTPMGVSISNTPSTPFIYAGTAGLLVHSMQNPSQKFILSNNHVLGTKGPKLCPNAAVPGTTRTLQPGTIDIGADPGNNPKYEVGLVAGFWPLVSGLNVVDAALSITNTSLAKPEILGIGEPNAAVGIASPGLAVTKGGRTTGVTSGTVDSVNATVSVNYGSGCPTYTFIGQTIIGPGTFSSAGDSGSAILDSTTKTPVGLLFAGSSTFTIANQPYWVYRIFGVFPDGAAGSIASAAQLDQVEANLEAQIDPTISAAAKVQARHETELFAIPGIRAVGIGRGAHREVVLKVYGVKITPAMRRAVPEFLEGLPVVLQDTGTEVVAR